jgi:hypothetical protein
MAIDHINTLFSYPSRACGSMDLTRPSQSLERCCPLTKNNTIGMKVLNHPSSDLIDAFTFGFSYDLAGPDYLQYPHRGSLWNPLNPFESD